MALVCLSLAVQQSVEFRVKPTVGTTSKAVATVNMVGPDEKSYVVELEVESKVVSVSPTGDVESESTQKNVVVKQGDTVLFQQDAGEVDTSKVDKFGKLIPNPQKPMDRATVLLARAGSIVFSPTAVVEGKDWEVSYPADSPSESPASTLKYKFVKVETVAGRQVAFLEFTFEEKTSGGTTGTGRAQVDVATGDTLEMELTLKDAYTPLQFVAKELTLKSKTTEVNRK